MGMPSAAAVWEKSWEKEILGLLLHAGLSGNSSIILNDSCLSNYSFFYMILSNYRAHVYSEDTKGRKRKEMIEEVKERRVWEGGVRTWKKGGRLYRRLHL